MKKRFGLLIFFLLFHACSVSESGLNRLVSRNTEFAIVMNLNRLMTCALEQGWCNRKFFQILKRNRIDPVKDLDRMVIMFFPGNDFAVIIQGSFDPELIIDNLKGKVEKKFYRGRAFYETVSREGEIDFSLLLCGNEYIILGNSGGMTQMLRCICREDRCISRKEFYRLISQTGEVAGRSFTVGEPAPAGNVFSSIDNFEVKLDRRRKNNIFLKVKFKDQSQQMGIEDKIDRYLGIFRDWFLKRNISITREIEAGDSGLKLKLTFFDNERELL